VVFRVELSRLVAMVLGMKVVRAGNVGVVGCLLVVADVMGPCGLPVVPCGVVMVLGRLVMMLQLLFVGHDAFV
jgi:hypothetical protein